MYTYSVNDLGLKKFLQLYGINGHFTVCMQIEHYAIKIAFCVQCYIVFYIFLQLIILVMESIHIHVLV